TGNTPPIGEVTVAPDLSAANRVLGCPDHAAHKPTREARYEQLYEYFDRNVAPGVWDPYKLEQS
ncbi:MAG TPA: hypothetical protein VH744_13245, partial [Terriglobales bacterium]